MRSLVLGHRGLVGQALMRRMPDADTLGAELNVAEVSALPKADCVYLAAAFVGGIGANVDLPGDMIAGNLAIQGNVIEQCARRSKLCFLGSSCIYPRDAAQPITESQLMTGPLEPTNSAYAIAKIAGIEMCRAYAKQYGLKYVALMPCNLYGPGRPNDTHVINMLMRRFHEAKIQDAKVVSVWGTGRALREFMHVDDLADAAVHFMGVDEPLDLVNVGTGAEISIEALATVLAEIVGYKGDIEFDHTKPDGTPRKVLDVSKAARLGWTAKISLVDGLRQTYEAYFGHT